MFDAEASARASRSAPGFRPPATFAVPPGCPQIRVASFGTVTRRYIRHPWGSPIHCEQARLSAPQPLSHEACGQCGIYFETARPFRPGVVLGITIPLRGERFRFLGRICWTEEQLGGYEVGIAFDGWAECFRARMVEQLCHIEAYRESVYTTEGRQLDSERAAAEWIDRYAALFPAI